jgi:hypothetical protein
MESTISHSSHDSLSSLRTFAGTADEIVFRDVCCLGALAGKGLGAPRNEKAARDHPITRRLK